MYGYLHVEKRFEAAPQKKKQKEKWNAKKKKRREETKTLLVVKFVQERKKCAIFSRSYRGTATTPANGLLSKREEERIFFILKQKLKVQDLARLGLRALKKNITTASCRLRPKM